LGKYWQLEEIAMSNPQREKLYKEIHFSLGGGLVRVELTPDHFDTAIDFALEMYRMRSKNSTEERTAFLPLKPDQTVYYLPEEIVEVRQIFRRTIGSSGSGGAGFDPFSAALTNQFLMQGGSNQSSLATYEMFTGFQELVGIMFGLYLNFSWDPTAHRLEIVRNIKSEEEVLLWIYNYRPEEVLFSDIYARPWLRRYAAAQCKLMLAEARGKFGVLPGPQGSGSLNADALRASAEQEIQDLLLELDTQRDQDMGYGFVIG
jgi:hypothetical protein